MFPTLIILASVLMLAAVLACAWPTGNRYRIVKIADAFLYKARSFVASCRLAFCETRQAANAELGVGVHEGSFSKYNDAVITTRHLLYKYGTDVNHIAVISATTDIPIGTVPDSAATTEQPLGVMLLGRGATKKMVANAAIAAGAIVTSHSNGKVVTLPVGAGSCWQVGVALTAAAAANDVIEVNCTTPCRITV